MEYIENVSERAEQMSGQEGQATKQIEKVTAAVPSTTWLIAAGASIVGALALKLSGRHTTANFVGQWAPTFLLLGLYNKIVKVMGSERREAGAFSH